MSRGAAKDSSAAPRLIVHSTNHGLQPSLHSFAATAAKIGCVIYFDALTRRGFELINEIYDQGRLNPIMLENPMVFLSVILTVPRTVPP